jgi:hypothetical protein
MTSTTRSALFMTGGQVPHGSIYNDYDPLLIPGAAATLIGWADQPLTDTTSINGQRPSGHQENFIQAPLNIDLSQSKQIPYGLLPSKIADIQSYTAQAALSGLYSLSVGTVTFETQIPSSLSVQRLLITQPDLAAQPDAQGSVPSGAASALRANLYNWQRNAWEPVAFDQAADNSALITQPDAYVGPGGRVLLQISSQNNASIYFSKPLLAVNTLK